MEVRVLWKSTCVLPHIKTPSQLWFFVFTAMILLELLMSFWNLFVKPVGRTRIPAYPHTRISAYPHICIPAYPHTRVPAFSTKPYINNQEAGSSNQEHVAFLENYLVYLNLYCIEIESCSSILILYSCKHLKKNTELSYTYTQIF